MEWGTTLAVVSSGFFCRDDSRLKPNIARAQDRTGEG